MTTEYWGLKVVFRNLLEFCKYASVATPELSHDQITYEPRLRLLLVITTSLHWFIRIKVRRWVALRRFSAFRSN
jgi:hypothetical protein